MSQTRIQDNDGEHGDRRLSAPKPRGGRSQPRGTVERIAGEGVTVLLVEKNPWMKR